jgi:hypothetical protein
MLDGQLEWNGLKPTLLRRSLGKPYCILCITEHQAFAQCVAIQGWDSLEDVSQWVIDWRVKASAWVSLDDCVICFRLTVIGCQAWLNMNPHLCCGLCNVTISLLLLWSSSILHVCSLERLDVSLENIRLLESPDTSVSPGFYCISLPFHLRLKQVQCLIYALYRIHRRRLETRNIVILSCVPK